MSLIPPVTAIERTEDAITLAISVSPMLDYFPGHFPGVPILPGVVQVDWAVRFAHEYLAIAVTGFSSLRAIKFSAPVLPGSSLLLRLSWHANKQRLDFSYRDDLRTVSSGQIVFAEQGIA